MKIEDLKQLEKLIDLYITEKFGGQVGDILKNLPLSKKVLLLSYLMNAENADNDLTDVQLLV